LNFQKKTAKQSQYSTLNISKLWTLHHSTSQYQAAACLVGNPRFSNQFRCRDLPDAFAHQSKSAQMAPRVGQTVKPTI
jgi:hypothetical protein